MRPSGVARPDPASPGRPPDAGFTLLELLVCLALMAVIAAFALPRFAADRPPSFERSAQAIAADIGRLREAAIGTGAVQRTAAASLEAVLPAGVSFGATVPPEIVFFPNGMANGAVWRLEAADRAIDLEVDWLTGGVTLHAR